jgi:hypothetical protein
VEENTREPRVSVVRGTQYRRVEKFSENPKNRPSWGRIQETESPVLSMKLPELAEFKRVPGVGVESFTVVDSSFRGVRVYSTSRL